MFKLAPERLSKHYCFGPSGQANISQAFPIELAGLAKLAGEELCWK